MLSVNFTADEANKLRHGSTRCWTVYREFCSVQCVKKTVTAHLAVDPVIFTALCSACRLSRNLSGLFLHFHIAAKVRALKMTVMTAELP